MKLLKNRNILLLSTVHFFQSAAVASLSVIIMTVIAREKLQHIDAEMMLWLITIGAFVAAILGGLIGDLTNRKNTILAGALLAAAGAIILALDHETNLVVGVALIIMGSGWLNPNINALAGIEIREQDHWLDSLFTWFLVIITMSQQISGSLTSQFYEYYTPAKILIVLCFLISGILILFIRSSSSLAPSNSDPFLDSSAAISKSGKSSLIVVVIGFLILFRLASHIESSYMMSYYSNTNNPILGQMIYVMAYLAVGIALAITWYHVRVKSIVKVLIGIGIVLISVLVFYMTYKAGEVAIGANSGPSLVIGLGLIILARLFIVPSVTAIVNRYGNRKYLSTLNSLLLFPKEVFNFIFMIFFLNMMDGHFH